MTKVLMLLAHNAMPHEGHLEGIYHILSYLKGHENSKLVFDPAYPEIDDRQFKDVDWKDFYPKNLYQFNVLSLEVDVSTERPTQPSSG